MMVSEFEVPPVHDGGLLIHPALFVLTPFHLYSTTYDALIRAEVLSFAVYSAPRVYQDLATMPSRFLNFT
jgi:hypothetical protein